MKDKLIHFLWRRRTAVFAIGPLIMLLLARPTWGSWLAGLPFVAFGELIRFWSAGHLVKNSEVITSGPFGYVRNPLYVGSFCVFCGLCVMANRWDLLLPFFFIFAVFHLGAVIYEERYLLETFGDDFRQYCKRVPRFVPRVRSMGKPGKFSFSLACSNREPRSAFGTTLMVVLFAVRAVFPSVDVIGRFAQGVHLVLSVLGKV